MINKKRKKKKGFTLIELVIVLAVLAIIALIAIPNFTKVRNDSLTKADAQTMDQIKKITLMAIANEDVKVSPTTASEFIIGEGGAVTATSPATHTEGFKQMLKEVKNAQVNGKDAFKVTVMTSGDVTVTYTK